MTDEPALANRLLCDVPDARAASIRQVKLGSWTPNPRTLESIDLGRSQEGSEGDGQMTQDAHLLLVGAVPFLFDSCCGVFPDRLLPAPLAASAMLKLML